VEPLSAQRPGYGTIRTDQAQIDAEFLSYRQGKLVTATGRDHDFNPEVVCAPDGSEILVGDMELGFSRVPSISRARRRMGSDAIEKFSIPRLARNTFRLTWQRLVKS